MSGPATGPGTTPPAVSVVVPAFQVAPYIAEALASVVAQTWRDWELILVNDGSPDTPALEQAIAPFRDRITYLTQENRGAGAARNAAIRVARGEWLAFLDGDDTWFPGYLERQMAELEARGLDLVWSDGLMRGDPGREGVRMTVDSPSHGPVTVEALLWQRVIVFTSATVVRRAAVVAVGGFEEGPVRAEDFVLWVRLVQQGFRAGYHHEPLIWYRVRRDGLSGDDVSAALRVATVFRHLSDCPWLGADHRAIAARQHRDAEALHAAELGKRSLMAREHRDARRYFAEARRWEGSPKRTGHYLLVCLAPGIARWLLRRRRPGRLS